MAVDYGKAQRQREIADLWRRGRDLNAEAVETIGSDLVSSFVSQPVTVESKEGGEPIETDR